MSPHKKVFLIVAAIVCIFLVCFSILIGGAVWAYQAVKGTFDIEEIVLNDLAGAEQNANIAIIGDEKIYFHNKTVSKQDIPMENADFVYVDASNIYYYVVNSQTSTVMLYRTDHSFSEHEQIFQSQYNDNAHNFSVKAPGFICFESTSELYTCYDSNTHELYFDLESTEVDAIVASYSKSPIKVTAESVTLTANDNSTVVITTEQLKQVLMTQISINPDNFGILQAHVKNNNLYIMCRTTIFSVITFYKYDLNTGELSLCGWRKVVDHEGIKMFILNGN